MRLVQFMAADSTRRVGLVDASSESLQVLRDTERVYNLALEAHQHGISLAALVNQRVGSEQADYQQVISQNRLLLPLDHPDPAHCIVSGTGLDHLGSAQARDAMHTKLQSGELSDSMKMLSG